MLAKPHRSVIMQPTYDDARFRGFQYFRALIDSTYPRAKISPPFGSAELDEPDWREW